MIVYVGISKKPNEKKSLELITVFSNVAGYKIDMGKSTTLAIF